MADPFIYNDEILALNHLTLPEGAVIFDIGCSYGEYTLEVLKKVQKQVPTPNVTIHCFDPVEDFCNTQKERFKQYPFITVNNFGLSDKKETTMFFRIKAKGNQAAEGCSSLTLRPVFIQNKMPYVPTNVKIDTLQNYILENNIDHIDLIKIDVEGNEYNVLKGGECMFRLGMVDIIQIEYNDSWVDSGISMAEVINFITPYGYLLCDYISGKYVHIENFKEDYGFHNFYIIRKKYFDTL